MTPEQQYYQLNRCAILAEPLLTPQQCEEFANDMKQMDANGQLQSEAGGKEYNNSRGIYAYPKFEGILQVLTSFVERQTGYKLAPENSYARIYGNQDILRPHKDRDGLDVTMSLSLYNDTGQEWPLWAKRTDGSALAIVIPVGYGALMNGGELEHWRDELNCNADQSVIQLFLHWKIQE